MQESRISNVSSEIRTSDYKPDSLKQTQTYTATALLTLRVPSAMLDSVTSAMPRLSSFIDSRTLKQNDVTYHFMANEYKNRSVVQNGTGIQVTPPIAKDDYIAVKKYEEEKQDQKINRKIENMQILDEVSYATVTVELSKPEQVFVQTVVNPDYIMRTPFAVQCDVAINNGADFVKGVIVLMINIWPLLVVISIAAAIVYKLKRRPAGLAHGGH